MQGAERSGNSRLDHLGIVAGVCQERGLATWGDAPDPSHRQQVSVGTAPPAMIRNGLGFSNRHLSVVPHYVEQKPVEHVLGAGSTAEMLTDDGQGRTLDWLSAPDPPKRYAGRARQARQGIGVPTQQLQVDPTSFCVHGEDASQAGPEAPEPPVMQEAGTDPVRIAIPDGSSREQREDLTPGMLALAITHEGELPLFVQPWDGHSSDHVSL